MPARRRIRKTSGRVPRFRVSRQPREATGKRLILVIGGAASGKSRRALDLAGSRGRRAFVATAEALDAEMTERIRRHQGARDRDWTTEEIPLELVEWFEKEAQRYQIVVLDCLTIWLSNLQGRGASDGEIARLTTDLIRAMRDVSARVIVVTNEVGMSLVPIEAAARQFRDMAGAVNQRFAEAADEVHFVVSGVAFRIK